MKRANTLYEYYRGKGRKHEGLSERRKKYNLGDNYRGTAAQNTQLLRRLQAGEFDRESGNANTPPQGRDRNINTNIGGKVNVDVSKEYDLKNFTSGQLGRSDRLLNSLMDQATSRYEGEVDYDDIRDETEKKFRKEIRAINKSYSNLLSTELAQMQPELDMRVGRQVATSARGGMVGSARGNYQANQVERYNTQLEQNKTAEITAARDSKLSSLFGQIREYSQAEFARREEAQRKGGEDLLNYLAEAQERQGGIVNGVIAQMLDAGIDVDSLSEDELTSFAAELSIDKNDLKKFIPKAKQSYKLDKAEGDVMKMLQKGTRDPVTIAARLGLSLDDVNAVLKKAYKDPVKLSQGQGLFDPVTGKRISYNRKTYAPKSSSDNGHYVSIGADAPSFDDFVSSDEAESKLKEIEIAKGRELNDDELKEEATKLYTEKYANQSTKYKVTSSEYQDIQRAGLERQDGNTQSYFLALPSAFRDRYQALVANGQANFNSNRSNIQNEYDKWKTEKSSDASESLSELFGQMADAKFGKQ